MNDSKRNHIAAVTALTLVLVPAFQNCGQPFSASQQALTSNSASGGAPVGNGGNTNGGNGSGGNSSGGNSSGGGNTGNVPVAPATIEAEAMNTKTVGAQEGDFWNLWSEGSLEHTVQFPSAGSYEFSIVAKGSQAANIWPQMSLLVDDQAKGSTITVSSINSSTYKITTTVASGSHRIAIKFLNDGMSGSDDRNLYVDKVSVALGASSGPVAGPTPPPVAVPTPTPIPSTPTPAPVNGVARAFGTHPMQYAAGTIKPSVSQSAMDQAVKSSYDTWKSRYIEQMCGSGRYVVKGGQTGKLAVSEGQGYGMLITVMMAGYDPQARTIFDGIHRFARDHESNYAGMMDWVINNDCSSGGDWPAVDGDLDMALALVMAHVQWGSNGSINYLEEAKKTINAIKKNIVKSNVVAGGPYPDLARTSDFMFAHFRAFEKYTGDATWGAVLTKTQSLIEQISSAYAPTTGLQPDFIENADTNSPRPSTISRWPESNLVNWYSYNACRNPWRFGTDVVVTGDARSKAITQKMMNFFRNASGGNIHNIKAVYQLDGTIVQNYENMSFQAPLGVGAMVDSSNQAFLNNIWAYLSGNTPAGYYDHSIQLISLMVMSGNWWQP